MKRIISLFSGIALICLPLPSLAQTTVQTTVRVVGTCGSGVTWTAGKMNFPTVDTTGVLCTGASGGGGGVAGFTAEATASAVAAGTNKPASIDTVNGAQRVEPMKPGTTTAIDLSLPSGIFGADGATIASTSNPVPTQGQTQTDTVMLGGVNVKEINAVTPLMGNGVTGTGSQRVTIASDNTAFAVIPSNVVAQGSTTSGQTGALTQGAVLSTAAGPAYVTAQTSPLSLFTNGELRVGGGVTAGTADTGAPVKAGGKYLTTLPTLTTGQRGDLQITVEGSLRTTAGGYPIAGSDAQSNNYTSYPRIDQVGGTGAGALMVYNHTFNGTNWDRNRGISGSFGSALGVNAVEQAGSPFSHIAGAATTTVKSGAGILHKISINTKGAASTATVYDNTAGSGTVIAVIDLTLSQDTLIYDLAFATGLTIVTTGTLSDLTVSYR